MDELLGEFKTEAADLIEQLTEILDTFENELDQSEHLENFAQIVDRIMGGAKTIFEMTQHQLLSQIGTFAELCKTLGYRGSQIKDANILQILAALLQDATESLDLMVKDLGEPTEKPFKDVLTQTFLDRLHWIDSKIPKMPSPVGSAEKSQEEVDDLLKSLGISI